MSRRSFQESKVTNSVSLGRELFCEFRVSNLRVIGEEKLRRHAVFGRLWVTDLGQTILELYVEDFFACHRSLRSLLFTHGHAL